ncbi:MAG TPA: hypothetical protein VGC92_04115 [Phenylobacterium sp.]
MAIVLRRHRFWIKCALAAGLIALCDQLVRETMLGAGFGIAALAGLAAAVGVRPSLRRPRMAWIAFGLATGLALLEIENGGLPAFLLFAAAVAVGVLAPRAGAHDDAWAWAQRLVIAGLKSIWGPLGDALRLLKIRARSGP